MITPRQLEELGEFYKIDKFTVFREYLQLLFLSYFYQNKKSTKIYFKGGTAIHLLFGSPRFSEDLDFSSEDKISQIKMMMEEVEKQIGRELAGIKLLPAYQGKQSIRFRLKYQPPEFKYPFVIRLDFTEGKRVKKPMASPLLTKFPLLFFPVVVHLSAEEILAEKIRALLTRGKGRDIFDLWFLLGTGIKIDKNLLASKLKEVGEKFYKEKLIEKVKNTPQKKLENDLAKFLPRPQREVVGILKEKLGEKLTESF